MDTKLMVRAQDIQRAALARQELDGIALRKGLSELVPDESVRERLERLAYRYAEAEVAAFAAEAMGKATFRISLSRSDFLPTR